MLHVLLLCVFNNAQTACMALYDVDVQCRVQSEIACKKTTT